MIGGGFWVAFSTWTRAPTHATFSNWQRVREGGSALMPIFRCVASRHEKEKKTALNRRWWSNLGHPSHNSEWCWRWEENVQRRQRKKTQLFHSFYIYDPISVFIGCFSGKNSFTFWMTVKYWYVLSRRRDFIFLSNKVECLYFIDVSRDERN